MSKYFTMSEMTSSPTALRHAIKNSPGYIEARNLEWLMSHCLDRIREEWGHAIIVSSGYRCAELNRLVGGAPNSQHKSGCAADIKAVNSKDNALLFKMISESAIPFDQVIDEYKYSWIHVSCNYENYGNRHCILHLG
jgi:zinc D-Ala-D-Ala carboxypeptidase